MPDFRQEKIAKFVACSAAHITGDEKGEAQKFLDHLRIGEQRVDILGIFTRKRVEFHSHPGCLGHLAQIDALQEIDRERALRVPEDESLEESSYLR